MDGSGLQAQGGGEDVQQPKNPGPKPINFLPNKKLMTVMKFFLNQPPKLL